MILEALQYAATRAVTPKEFRPHIRYSVNLWARANRCAEAWAEHENNSRQFVLQSAGKLKQRRTAVVLGSGLLRDVPYDALVAMFDTVVLVDLVHLASLQAKLRLNAKRTSASPIAIFPALTIFLPAKQPSRSISCGACPISISWYRPISCHRSAPVRATGWSGKRLRLRRTIFAEAHSHPSGSACWPALQGLPDNRHILRHHRQGWQSAPARRPAAWRRASCTRGRMGVAARPVWRGKQGLSYRASRHCA